MADDAVKLVEACLAGDARAWDAFVDRFHRLVWSVPRSYRLCDADCDDVVQAVFLAALTHLEQLRAAERVSSWLVTCAHRESWRVGRARERPLDLAGDFASVADPAPERAQELEARQAVREGLERLGGRCRDLLTALFAVADPHYPTIAAQVGIPVGSIGPTRARCLEKLRALLENVPGMPGIFSEG